MKRRSILQLFGIGAAVVPVATVPLSPPTFETITRASDPFEAPARDINPLRDAHGFPDYLQAYDVQRAQLYSALELPAGELVSNCGFFGYGLGQSLYGRVSVAGYAETNLDRAGAIAAPGMFCVERMGLVFAPGVSSEDYHAIAQNCAFRFILGCKAYVTGPAAMFACRLDGDRPGRLPGPALVDLKPLPLIISHGWQFGAELVASPGMPELRAPLKVWAVLDGLRAWGIQ